MTVRGERWRIAEREPAGADATYDLTRLSGPAAGASGFTIGGARRTAEQLVAEVTACVDDVAATAGPAGRHPDPGSARRDLRCGP